PADRSLVALGAARRRLAPRRAARGERALQHTPSSRGGHMRRVLRRWWPLAGALMLLAFAAVFAVPAVHPRAWQSTLRRDDVRFTRLHSLPGLWRSPAILPGDPAEHLVGLGSGLEYRRALQAFWLAQFGGSKAARGSVTETRVETENDLQAV